MTDLSPAAQWLEEEFIHNGWAQRIAASHVIRPMFDVRYDHEACLPSRDVPCYVCVDSDELIVIEPEDRKE